MPIDFGKTGSEKSLTGRAVRYPKLLVEKTHRIDLAQLRRERFFEAEPATIWLSERKFEWGISQVLYSLICDDSGPVAVAFGHERPGSDDVRAYAVELESTECNFGGERFWFSCPLTVEGLPCHRRSRILYLPHRSSGSFFGCRECHRLTYRCNRWHRDLMYEGFVRPGELLMEDLRRPPWELSREQRLRRDRQHERARVAMERFVGSGDGA